MSQRRGLLAALLAAYLAGCAPEVPLASNPNEGSAAAGSESDGAAPMALAGSVRSGDLAVAGARVSIYAAGMESGPPAQPVAQAQSNAAGEFQLSFACPSATAGTNSASAIMYVIATGGEVAPGAEHGGQGNSAIHLIGMLGRCDRLPASIRVNELTTIAAGYALSAFIDDDTVGGSAAGLPNAAATAAALIEPQTGAPSAALPDAAACSAAAPPVNCEAAGKLNALANALAACDAAATATAPACALLFSCATAGAVDSGSGPCATPVGASLPANSTQAVLAIAHSPGLVSASGLFRAAAADTAFGPMPDAAPNDWALSLSFGGGGLSEPTALAIDASGHIWVANYTGAVTELSPTGSALSPSDGFAGGGLEESFGLAIDPAGHIWVCNEQSPATFNAGRGSITELAADGNVISGPAGFTGGGLDFPESLAIDAGGNVWITNFGNSTLTELTGTGAVMSPAGGFGGGGLTFPVQLAVDEAGVIWVANQGADRLSAFTSTGKALSSSAGYAGGGLAVPQGIAIDQQNRIWTSNYFGDSVSEFDEHGVPLSPATGFTGGGLATPGGIAIDGAGNVWVANYHAGSVSELAGGESAAPGSARSPVAGFTAASMALPFSMAIDASGNLWVSNFGNNTVTEFVGIAAPVATPLIGVPRSP